jgi:eukaryotic-like serine/threonine-protein kinase
MQKMIGKYIILNLIGQGGMGKIYKAIDPKSKRTLIIKQLMVSSQTILKRRFEREANIMMTLSHRNIVKVFNHFKAGKYNFIAMEYVDGISLEDLIKKKKKISSLPAILILNEICNGLQHAHDYGIIHRDIKPDNVLISKTGDVKLLDFGIATAKPGSGEDLTKTGTVMGTPSYMSPEQIVNSKDVDKRSDIYSLGVVLYQMLTGVKPFSSAFSAETIDKINKGIFDNPAKYVPDMPEILKKILKKTMNCKKNKRFKDVEECLKLLSKYMENFKNNSQIKNAIRKYLAGKDIIDEDSTEIDKSARHHSSNIIKIKLNNIQTKITIGREARNDVIISNDPHISRMHAIIERKGNNFYIIDNNSQNGVMINNKKISRNKKVKIHTNMLVFIGRTTLKLL